MSYHLTEVGRKVRVGRRRRRRRARGGGGGSRLTTCLCRARMARHYSSLSFASVLIIVLSIIWLNIIRADALRCGPALLQVPPGHNSTGVMPQTGTTKDAGATPPTGTTKDAVRTAVHEQRPLRVRCGNF